jgi:hypothetical protein
VSAVRPDRWCCRVVELAARILPAEHRQRYALEFVAELYGMTRGQQVRHSVQVLAHAWALRAAVADRVSVPMEEKAMMRTFRFWLLCRLYAAKRGVRPLIGVVTGVCQWTPQWRSSRSR